jgi:hypothetical protein
MGGRGSKEISGIEGGVLVVFPYSAVKVIGAGFGPDIHNGSIAAPVLTGEVARLDLDFRNRFQTRHDGGFALAEDIGVHRPIKHKVVATIAVAVDGDNWRADELRRNDCARNIRCSRAEARQKKNVALGNRQVRDLLALQRVPEPAFGRHRHPGRLGADFHRLLRIAHFQADVDLRQLPDVPLRYGCHSIGTGVA